MTTLHVMLFSMPLTFPSLIAHLVKNLPAMQETRVRFLGLEDPLEKEMATHSNILGEYLENSMERERAWQTTIHGVTKSQTRQATE